MKINKSVSLIAFGLMLAFMLNINKASAQGVEITPFAGYMFNGKVNFIQGDLRFSDDVDYGVVLGIPVRYGVIAELSYTRSESRASWSPSYYYQGDFPATEFNVNINYFQVGAIKEVEIQDNFFGFGGLTLGAAYYNTTSKNIADLWRFAFGFHAGFKYFFSETIGIRLQGRMPFPIAWGRPHPPIPFLRRTTARSQASAVQRLGPISASYNGSVPVRLALSRAPGPL